MLFNQYGPFFERFRTDVERQQRFWTHLPNNIGGDYGGRVSGETDLAKMLASLSIAQRPEAYVVVSLPQRPDRLDNGIEATIDEAEGTTVIATKDVADRQGWPSDTLWAWLTLEVHSSLEAVGLTAAFATALADEGLPCNVLAGYYHDHLLVPFGQADKAVGCLAELRRSP